jgi:hypothetical protein
MLMEPLNPRSRDGLTPLIELPGVIAVVSGTHTTDPRFAQSVACLQSTAGTALLWQLAWPPFAIAPSCTDEDLIRQYEQLRPTLTALTRPSEGGLIETGFASGSRVGRFHLGKKRNVQRQRGRPALVAGQTSKPVTFRVSSEQHDRICDRARRDRVSVPDVVRRALTKWLKEKTE